MDKVFQADIPLRIISEANASEHWSKKHKRHKKQKGFVNLYCKWIASIKPPCLIKLTRISPRKLDKDENLPMAFKYIKDAIADLIHPGLAPGRADDDDSISWEFAQEKGDPKTYSIKIEVFV